MTRDMYVRAFLTSILFFLSVNYTLVVVGDVGGFAVVANGDATYSDLSILANGLALVFVFTYVVRGPDGRDLRGALGVHAGWPWMLAGGLIGAIGLPFFLIHGGSGYSPLRSLFGVPAAIFEEIAVRGFLYRALQRYGRLVNAAVTTVVFALLHFEFAPSRLMALLIAGLVLWWLRHASGALGPGMLAHAIHNMLAFGF